MSFKREPYEISLWEDKLTKVTVNEIGFSYDKQYYKETRIATIGSDTMVTPIRAHSPSFNENINGTKVLVFSILARYFDDEIGDYVQNPFLSLLINERKVKLKYKNKWHVFYIKEIQEDSSRSTFTITCKDSYINELSKTGYEILLDSEIENNQGTIVELAETIVKGTDWRIDKDGSDLIKQYIEEPIYKAKTKSSIVLKNMEKESETLTVPTNSYVYLFYSNTSAADPYCQVIYRQDGLYEVDDDRNIINSKNWVVNRKVSYSGNLPDFISVMNISSEYKGKRLVRKNRTVFDTVLNRTVNIYKDPSNPNKEIRGYEEFTVLDTRLALNMVTNAEDFITTEGWIPGATAAVTDYVYPPINANVNSALTYYSLLKMDFTGSGSRIYNTGPTDNRSRINGFTKGEKYVFSIKHHVNPAATTPLATDLGLRAVIAEYTLADGSYVLGQVYANFSGNLTNLSLKEGDKFASQYIIGEITKSLSYKEMLRKKIGIFLSAKTAGTYYVEAVEVFPFYPDTTGNSPFLHYSNLTYLHPTATTYYYYEYKPEVKEESQISYIYKKLEPSSSYEKIYTQDFEKIRSITAKKSNVYNLIQTLCETFECWAEFSIEHNLETGELILDENFLPIKKIRFHEYVGQDNPRGFRYGINLDSIQRTLNSDSIVTKLIVEPNSNQFGINGFTTIARADENPTKQNTIFDFRYYINQGILDFSEVMNDFWLDSAAQGYIGYYKKLGQINKNTVKLIDEMTQLSANSIQENSLLQFYSIAYDEAESTQAILKSEIKNSTGYTYEQIKNNNPSGAKDKLKNKTVANTVTEIEILKSRSKKFEVFKRQAEENLDSITEALFEREQQLTASAEEARLLDNEFYKKYSRFLQEGSWISEDYIDDNLYYLDGCGVLAESAMPAVTYSIKVLELSQVDGYENYIFQLGDKTYIEDTEFFGWVTIDGMKTPYKEDIIVTNINYFLDAPESNTITVQNFKTQFEDLFQRITATTQSLQYASGNYQRAANIVDSDGTILPRTLQNSFLNNAFILSNSKDQSVVWDESGITITNLREPSEIVRLVSGGIFISKDGGSTWSSAVSGAGINATYLTAGQIDASKINIMGGAFSAFRWDDKGISAYRFSRNAQTGVPEYFNFSEFVRFDQFGLYGARGMEEDWTPSSIEDIKANSDFSVTWDGFRLKSKHPDTGYIQIDSEEDFQMFDGSGKNRIKIGRLGNNHYGLALYNDLNQPVFYTHSDGQLSLKTKLNIGPDVYNPRFELGFIESYTDKSYLYSKVLSIKDPNNTEKLTIYDDGRLIAQEAEIHGGIYASYGKIGNMTIQAVQEATEQFVVKTTTNTFRLKEGVASPNSAILTVDHANISGLIEASISWEWTTDFVTWTTFTGVSGKTFELIYATHASKFNSTGMITVRAKYSKWNSFVNISRIEDGDNPITFLIESTNGNQFKDNGVGTVLTARLYQKGIEIDPYGSLYTYTWTKWVGGVKDVSFGNRTGKSLTLLNSDVETQAVFKFEAT